MKTLALNADLSKLNIDPADERQGLPSASAAPRLANCPGSWRMEMNQPHLTKYAKLADSGTRIHNWLAGAKGETLTPSESRTAQSLSDAHVSIVDAWLAKVAPGTEANNASVEERWFLHSGIMPVTSGKWDVLVTAGAHHLVLDYKTGWQELPPVRSNLQMRVYALLVWQKFPEAESITVAIVREGDEEKDDPWMFTYHRLALESAWQWWANVLNGVFSASPPLVAGGHCQFCRAQYTCPARISAVSEFTATAKADDWSMLPVDTREKFFKLWKAAELVGKSIAQKVREDMDNGTDYPGLTIGKGRAEREVEDAQAAYVRVTKEGMTHDEFMECVSVSFAKLRDTLQPKKGWKKKDATANTLGILAGIVSETTTRGSIEIL